MRDTTESRAVQTAHLELLAKPMRCRVTRDECLDPVIQGKRGNVHVDGLGYSVAVLAPTRHGWNLAKEKTTGFCQVRQDGDTEGVLHVPVLPNKGQAVVIRRLIKAHKVKECSPETLERLRASSRLHGFKPVAGTLF